MDLKDHFSESRIQFYSAESLRVFSRDTLPPGEFKKLQDEFYGGIMMRFVPITPMVIAELLQLSSLLEYCR